SFSAAWGRTSPKTETCCGCSISTCPWTSICYRSRTRSPASYWPTSPRNGSAFSRHARRDESKGRLRALPFMSREAEGFLQAILAAPEDDTPRLVYADWLEERGDPRGEFIRIQCELAAMNLAWPNIAFYSHYELFDFVYLFQQRLGVDPHRWKLEE